MSLSLEQLKREALDLSPEDRTELAIKLWISTIQQEDISTTWEAEITARIASMGLPLPTLAHAEEAVAKLKKKLNQTEI